MRKFPIFLACIIATMAFILMAAGLYAAAETDAPVTEPPEVSASPSPSPSPTPRPTAAPIANTDFTISVDIGYDGLVIMSRWSPTFASIINEGAEDFDGMLGVNVFTTLSQYDRYEIPLTLASGATKRVLLPIKPQTRQDMYAFELVRDGEIIAEQRTAPKRLVAPETLSIGLLSDEPEALTFLNQRANGLDTLRGEVWMTIPLTVDNFPETADLMSAFSMLVVDGIDVRTLSEAQQQALSTWLLKGGFVLVSGGAQAATGYPYFSEWTGLTAGKLEEVEDITPELLSYATLKGKAVGEPVWLSALPKAGSLAASGDNGLLFRHRAGDGLIFTAAFDMGGKPLSSWVPMANFWPRMIRQSAATDYMRLLNHAEESRYNYNEMYRSQELVNQLRVPNEESGIPVMLVLAIYLALVGFGGYLILKRVDRREWLWVAAPACAVVFALLLFALSRGTTMNKPVALTASRVTLEGENAQLSTYIGVATPDGGELTISTNQDQLPMALQEDNYWYDDPSIADKLYRPDDLRQTFRLGAKPAVGFASNDAWDVKMLSLPNAQQQIGSLETRVWMEKDGLHGEAVNNTEFLLKDCMAITSFGYSIIGDVLPGQATKFLMLHPKEKIDQSAPDFKYEPNVLYSTLDFDLSIQGGYSDNNFYNFLNAALNNGTDPTQPWPPEVMQRQTLVQMFEDGWSFYENRSAFYFFGFNDSVGKVEVSLGDTPVTRTAHTAVIGNRIAFEPIGPTGQVMFPQGIIPAEVIVDEGDDKKPRLPTDADGTTNGNNMYGSTDTYLSLGSPAALRFVIPEWGTFEVERMTLAGSTYETMPQLYLYNHDTEEWDEQRTLSVTKTGSGWTPYVDADGILYARYVPNESANRYEGMQMPTIALKGEVK